MWPSHLLRAVTRSAWLSEPGQKPCRFESALYCFSEGLGLAFPKVQKEIFVDNDLGYR